MTAAAITARSPRRRNNLGLVIHQIRYEQLSFWRNPQSAIFTFVFPVLFVTIMGALFGSVGRSSYFGGLSALQYYVPTIAALCVLGSCFGQLVLFPLLFLSGTYMPIHAALLNRVAGWLPVRPFNEALTGPLSRHTGADWRHLAVLAAWGVLGAIVAVRRFRWDPRPQ